MEGLKFSVIGIILIIVTVCFVSIEYTSNYLSSKLFTSQFVRSFDEKLDVLDRQQIQSMESNLSPRRRLDDTEENIKAIVRKPGRYEKFKKVLNLASNSPAVQHVGMTLTNSSFPLNPYKNAIVTCAFSPTYSPRDVTNFVGTARRSGYIGDIVVAILPNTNSKVLARLAKFNATVLQIDGVSCRFEQKNNPFCSLAKGPKQAGAEVAAGSAADGGLASNVFFHTDLPLTLIRFIVYQAIIAKYSLSSTILIADFRDTVFQTNPFRSKTSLGLIRYPYDLFVFQDSIPNKVISRCPQTIGWIVKCYGDEMLKHIGHNAVSTSGIVMGTRSAMLTYSYLITSQIEASHRTIYNSTIPPQAACLMSGVDQGFHNAILYAGILSKYLDIRIFPQGEGPVNVLGGFFGEKKLLRAHLKDWKIIRGEAPFKYVYNWNGELSPVVHQLDRFIDSELEGGFEANMAVFQNIYG